RPFPQNARSQSGGAMPHNKSDIRVAVIGAVGAILVAVISSAVTYRINYEQRKPSMVPMTTADAAGRYEWQTIRSSEDEPWSGYIDMDGQGDAKIQMWRYRKCPPHSSLTRLQLLQQDGRGEMSINNKGQMHLRLPVRFVVYDKNCRGTGLE